MTAMLEKAEAQGLDAAIAAAEALLPGWCWEVRWRNGAADAQGAPHWWNEGLVAVDAGGVCTFGAKTPAAALCSAVRHVMEDRAKDKT